MFCVTVQDAQQRVGSGVWSFGLRGSGFGNWVSDFGIRDLGFGGSVYKSEMAIRIVSVFSSSISELRVAGFEFRVSGPGFRV
jgi:hypothetical protein